MPKWSAGAAATVAIFGGFLLGGCAVQREPLVLVEPEFSYLRDGDRAIGMSLAEVELTPIELAEAPSLDAGTPIELTEPSLLRPAARRLVQGEQPQPQP